MVRGLFVGRFQPFHYGHLHAIKYILNKVDDMVIVIGSAQMSHEPDNPFTAGERIMMIRAALDSNEIDPSRYLLIPIQDAPAHRVWVSLVESQTPKFDIVYTNQPLTRRLLIEAGYNVMSISMHMRQIYEATEIRQRILKKEDWSQLVPPEVFDIIKQINGENRIRDLAKTDALNKQPRE